MKPLIISWVGAGYNDSVLIGQILIISMFFIFINMPYTYLMISLEKTRILNINSLILPFVFLTLTLLLKNTSSLLAVAIAKTSAFFLSSIFLYFSFKITNFRFFYFIYKRILSIIFSLITLILIYYLFYPYLKIESNSTTSIAKTIIFGFILASISFIVYLSFSKDLALFGKNILANALSNSKNNSK
jgi:O-antigen/teichoic acid export membrane protein